MKGSEGVDVLVTGGAGFVGAALVGRLLGEGRTAGSVDLLAGIYPTRRMDVTDAAEVDAVIALLRPTVIVHAAAIVDDRVPRGRMFAVNVEGTRHVARAAIAHGVERLVHVSSIAALGLDPGPRAGADSPLRTQQGAAYFDSKARAEQVVREVLRGSGVDLVIVRPGDVWGPRSEPWVERPLAMMRARQPVMVGGGRGFITHCHIDNLVDALRLAVDHPEATRRPFIVHDGERTTYAHYFRALAAAAGLRGPGPSIPAALARTAAKIGERAAASLRTRPPLTEGAVRYLLRTTEYSLREAEAVGYAPRVGLDEGMARLFPSEPGR